MQTKRIGIALCLLILPWTAAWGDDPYPSRPVKLVVGGAPGGGWDLASRLIAEKMQESLRQPVVVDNRPGADGIIAATAVTRSAGDGYTLMPAVSAQMTMNPVLQDKLPYDAVHGFEAVSMIGYYPLVLVANPGVPVNSLRDLIAYAKAHPDALNYGSGSSGFRFAMERFKEMSGIELRRIGYKGSAQTVNALLAGDVQIAIVDVAPALQHIRAGKLKALGVTTARRVPFLPDTPTFTEAGVPTYEVVLWIGMFAPAGTPRDVIARLNDSIVRGLEAPDLRERLMASGIIPGSSTPQALAETVRRDIDSISAMARSGHLAAE